MSFRFPVRFALGLALATVLVVPLRAEEAPLEVTLLAINDFHGNLLPPAGGFRMRDPVDPTKFVTVPAGGAEAMATLIKQKRAEHRNSMFVAAGDLVGASPLLSALFGDEPTIESLSVMGLEASAVGNHEFDKGVVELLRKQNGGCGTDVSCLAMHPFLGAKFQYLAASTIDTATAKPILPAYKIKTFDGVPVAFVGLALKGVPGLVRPSGVAGVEFRDEAETVNALVPELKAQGVEAIVVLIHEGGFPTGGYNECPGISGPIVDIVTKLDKAVGVVISGHTHQAYVCSIDGRLVTSGDKFGTIVTEVSMTLDRATKRIVEAKADNLIVRTDAYAKDPEQTALIGAYERVAAPMIAKPVGRIAQTLERDDTPTGETPLGDAIADAMLAASRAPDKGGAVIAFTNPGGIRTALTKSNPEGIVTHGDVFGVLPFGNNLVTVTLTGSEIHTVLERQWLNQPKKRVLQVSKGFAYVWDESRAPGERVDPASITLDGKPLDPAGSYRVTINDFLHDGGDGFETFKTSRDPVAGDGLVDAVEAWIGAAGVVAVPEGGRIGKR